MLGWQLYLGAAFIKLFGFSSTAVRMGTLLAAMAMASRWVESDVSIMSVQKDDFTHA
jgi:hypothetical protein